jgi:hypothetical protein
MLAYIYQPVGTSHTRTADPYCPQSDTAGTLEGIMRYLDEDIPENVLSSTGRHLI